MDDSEIQALDSVESTHWWYQNRREILSEFLEVFPKHIKVLDLGSASGSNTSFMQEMGFEKVTSVEYSEFGCELQRAKGIVVINADACNLPFPSGFFDVIICLDVIEHIENDEIALSEIFRVLGNEGKALISVPEDMRLWSSHDTAVGHYRRYSRELLIHSARNLGFSVEKTFSSHMTLKPLIRIFRKFSTGSNLGPVNPILNLILNFACQAERKLNLSRFSGTTLWMVLAKL